MEVLNGLVVAIGGLSLVAAVAEIRNRLILRAERKKAEAERKEAERRAEAEAKARAERPTAKEIYFALTAKDNKHIGAPRLYR